MADRDSIAQLEQRLRFAEQNLAGFEADAKQRADKIRAHLSIAKAGLAEVKATFGNLDPDDVAPPPPPPPPPDVLTVTAALLPTGEYQLDSNAATPQVDWQYHDDTGGLLFARIEAPTGVIRDFASRWSGLVRVTANEVGGAGRSGSITVDLGSPPPAPPPGPLPAPTGLTQSAMSGGGVQVSFTAVPGADSHEYEVR